MNEDDAVETAIDEAAPEGQEEQQQDGESRARRLGWVPKEDFRGDPERWRSADEFLKVGEEHLGAARENNRKLQDQLDRMTSEMAEIKQASSEFRDFASKAEERSYKRARSEIDGQMRHAVENADTQAFDAARQRMSDLETDQRPAPKPNGQVQIAPEVNRWIDDNAWFRNDPELNAVATAVHGRILRDKPSLSLTDNLAEVKTEVMRRYSDKFGNPRREAASSVAAPGAGNGARRPRGKSYDDLPPEAKSACDKFVKTIPGYKREEYIKDYDWSA